MSKLTLLIGRQGSGKSTNFAQIARSLKDKSLILDPGGAPVYSEFPQIRAQDAWKLQNPAIQGKVYRLLDTGDRSAEISHVFGYDPETRILNKGKAYLNGNLFLEDAGAYLDSNLTRQVRSKVKAFKQHGLNLYLSYHSIDEISQEILRLNPHFLILKKTGDLNVFGKITKAQKFANYLVAQDAFYRAKFKGMSESDIVASLPPVDLVQIARELRIQPDHIPTGRQIPPVAVCKLIAKDICKMFNKKLKISAKEKLAGKYHFEAVQLRD